MTSNRCIPVQNACGGSAMVSCACGVFCFPFHGYDRRTLVTMWDLAFNALQLSLFVFDLNAKILKYDYVLLCYFRQKVWSESFLAGVLGNSVNLIPFRGSLQGYKTIWIWKQSTVKAFQVCILKVKIVPLQLWWSAVAGIVFTCVFPYP
jgi:hypothetical protein